MVNDVANCGRLQEFLGHKEHIYLCNISKYFTALLIKFPLMGESTDRWHLDTRAAEQGGLGGL